MNSYTMVWGLFRSLKLPSELFHAKLHRYQEEGEMRCEMKTERTEMREERHARENVNDEMRDER